MLNVKNKVVLILAPHTDDGELGVGGSISKMLEENAIVYYVAFSTAEQSVPEGFPKDILKSEVKLATQELGIKPENLIIFNYEVRKLNYSRQEILEELIKLKNKLSPDIVFLPSANDIHQDHSTISNEGIRAFKNSTILGYELIWNNLKFETQAFFKLEKKHIDRKIKSLNKYTSQGSRDYLSSDFIRSLAKTRGVQIGSEYAEVFDVIRLVWK